MQSKHWSASGLESGRTVVAAFGEQSYKGLYTFGTKERDPIFDEENRSESTMGLNRPRRPLAALRISVVICTRRTKKTWAKKNVSTHIHIYK